MKFKILVAAVVTSLAFGTALPVFAEDDADIPNPFTQDPLVRDMTTKRLSNPAKQADAACVLGALAKREAAVIDSVSAYAATVKSALEIRRDALEAAWALTDITKRKSALRAAWSTFSGTWKKASVSMRQTRKGAWTTFRTELKTCNQPMLEPAGEGQDLNI